MKKFTTIILGAALVFAAAGQVKASTLETSGQFRARYWYANNFKFGDTNLLDDSMDWWDQRLRLNTTWKVTDTVKVITRADILENYWQTGQPPLWSNSDASKEIDFDWAYATFDVGPVVASAGKMDVTWGPGIYAAADNRYRLKLATKFDKISTSIAWDVMAETFDSGTKDDDNGFSVTIASPIADWNVGFMGAYRTNGYIDGSLADTRDYDISFFAGDVWATGAFGPVKFNGEFAYLSGEREQPGEDQDLTGMIAYAGAFMPAGPVNVGLEFAYAAGNDPDSSDENEGALPQDYQGPFNSFILFTPFDFSGWQSNYEADTGVSNAIAAKASVTYAATQKLSLIGAVIWAQADEKQLDRRDDDMGVEFNGLARYALNENVTLQAGVGYLSAGDYFKVGDFDVNNPLVVTAHAIVTF
jgi:hypothetical protein